MKRFANIPFFFLLLFIVMSLFLSSLAMAYDPKKDLVSAINLKAAGFIAKKILYEKETEGTASRELSIPVSDGLSTYLDCSSPARYGLGSQETAKDFRAVIGLQFILK